MPLEWLKQSKHLSTFYSTLVLSLLPLLSSRMSKPVGTKGKRWFSVWLYCVLCAYTIQIHIRWKTLPGLLEPNKWKGCPWPKSTGFSETAPEMCQVWELKPQSISPFPLADRLLRKNRRGFLGDILSVREKKKPSWINVDFEENDIA